MHHSNNHLYSNDSAGASIQDAAGNMQVNDVNNPNYDDDFALHSNPLFNAGTGYVNEDKEERMNTEKPTRRGRTPAEEDALDERSAALHFAERKCSKYLLRGQDPTAYIQLYENLYYDIVSNEPFWFETVFDINDEVERPFPHSEKAFRIMYAFAQGLRVKREYCRVLKDVIPILEKVGKSYRLVVDHHPVEAARERFQGTIIFGSLLAVRTFAQVGQKYDAAQGYRRVISTISEEERLNWNWLDPDSSEDEIWRHLVTRRDPIVTHPCYGDVVGAPPLLCLACGISQDEVGRRFDLCSGCENALYCSKNCQKQHWKMHKPNCQRVRQERKVLEVEQRPKPGSMVVEFYDDESSSLSPSPSMQKKKSLDY